jgi:SpoVK/Ycf46/Vps4 family AAA+-type ATPase
MNDIHAGDLPKGIQSITALPNNGLADLWDSIIIEEAIRQRLISQAVLNFSMRQKVSRTILPLHGVILLVGPPGTGKTSLAKGLANKVAEVFKDASFKLIEVEAHGLTSSAMGKTQRAVADLFSQTISELASAGPTIILLDEVETLAVDRSKLSLDANPVDIHRATDAVLVQLDLLAETHKNLLFIATSNFPEAIDSAFVSRCDLVLEVPLPNEAACKTILEDCLLGLGETYPKISALTKDSKFAACASTFVGLDGRTIRKAVANALASDTSVALKPETMTIAHLASAANVARQHRSLKGVS